MIFYTAKEAINACLLLFNFITVLLHLISLVYIDNFRGKEYTSTVLGNYFHADVFLVEPRPLHSCCPTPQIPRGQLSSHSCSQTPYSSPGTVWAATARHPPTHP